MLTIMTLHGIYIYDYTIISAHLFWHNHKTRVVLQECLEAVVLGGQQVVCSHVVAMFQPLLGALSRWTSALTNIAIEHGHRNNGFSH